MCDRVGVLYAGRLVEEGATATSSTIRAIPTPSACCAACRRGGRRKDAGRLDTIPGFLPALGSHIAGLRLRRALRAGRRALPRRRAAASIE